MPTVSSIYFLDSRVENSQQLISQLPDGAVWFIIPPDVNGISFISLSLASFEGLGAVHLVSHGQEASLVLGSSLLTGDNLAEYQNEISDWQQSVSDTADLLLYGCDVASTDDGVDFVEALSNLTGMDVAASDDSTGLLGDDVLEITAGSIESAVLNVSDSGATLQTVTFGDQRDEVYADGVQGDTSGDDVINLGAGNDYLEAWMGGSDSIYAGDGDDRIWTDGWYYHSNPTNTILSDVDFIDGGDGRDVINIDTWGGLPLEGEFLLESAASTNGFEVAYRIYSPTELKQDFLVELNADGSGQVSYNYSAPYDTTPAPYVFLEFVNVEALAFNTLSQTLLSDPVSERFAVFQMTGTDVIAHGAADITMGTDDQDFINGSDGDDFIVARDGGWDKVWAGDGKDLIIGGSNNRDFLFGGAGNDRIEDFYSDAVIVGGSGDDTLVSRGGNDIFIGGDGVDTFIQTYYGDAYSRLIVDLRENNGTTFGTTELVDNAGNWINYSGNKTDALFGIENVQLHSDTDGSLRGNDLDNVLVGGSGNDYIEGGLGNDTLIGGAGEWDRVGYVDQDYGVNVNLATGIATRQGGEIDTLSGFENVVGSDSSDTITGDANGNFIVSRRGSDTVDGGDGHDTISYEFINDAGVTINLASGTAQVTSGTYFFQDSLTSIENAHGTHQADTITLSDTGGYIYARGGDDNLTGGAGNDWFHAGMGNDSIDGGAGVDRVTYYNDGYEGADPTREGIDFRADGTVIDLWGNTDTLTNIEIVEGSQYHDRFYGTSGDDHFIGGDGSDHLHGNAGNDTLDGGEDSNGWGDYANYFDAASGVTVNLQDGKAWNDGDGGVDTLISIENIEGSNFDDNITGDAGKNWFRTHKGNDTVDGGDGDDLIFYSHLGAVWAQDIGTNFSGIVADLSQTIGSYSSITYTIDGSTYTDSVTSIENLHGSVLGDVITLGDGDTYVFGEDGDDQLTGGAGNNNFHGGEGNDTIDGGAGRDRISYSDTGTWQSEQQSRGVNVNLETGVVTDNFGDIDTVSNIQDVTGSSLSDVIRGDWQDNNIDGKEGDDEIYGHGGNDYIRGGSGNNRLWGDQGNDTLIGGEGKDQIWGGDGDDYIDVSAYNRDWVDDTVHAGLGANTIIGNEERYHNGPGMLLGYDDIGNVGGLIINIASDGTGTTRSQSSGLINDTFSYASNFWLTMESDILLGADNDRHEDYIGFAGDDYFDGRGGEDHLRYDRDFEFGGTSAITIDFAQGYAIDGFGDRDTFTDIEGMRGTWGADLAIGNADQDYVFYQTMAGDDTVVGTDGWDILQYANEKKYNNLEQGIDARLDLGYVIDTFGDRDTVSKIDRVEGTDFADTMRAGDQSIEFDGRGGDDTLYGGAGDDRLTGGSGNDDLYGGAGNDRLEGQDGDDYLEDLEGDNKLYGDAGNDFIVSGAGRDNIAGHEGRDTIYAGHGRDFISMEDGFDIANGNENDDYVDGGGYEAVIDNGDLLDSGDDFDTISYAGSMSGVQVNFTAGNAFGLTTGTDTIVDIERVIGTYFDDILIGSDSDEWESFTSLAGNDVIIGLGGMDDLFLGDEAEGVYVDLSKQFQATAADFAVFDANLDINSLINGAQAAVITTTGVKYLSGIESVLGSNYDDTLIGSANDDWFAGDWYSYDGHPNTPIGGSDTIDGGAGKDTVFFDWTNYDAYPELGGVIVDLGDLDAQGYGWAIDQAGNVDKLKSIEVIEGSQKDDTLRGSNADEEFYGNAGRDHIQARGGNDIIDTSGGSVESQPWGDYVMAGLGHDTIIGHQALYEGGDGIDISYQDIDAGTAGISGIELTVNGSNGAGSGTVKSLGDAAAAIDDTFTFTHFFHGSTGDDVLTDSVVGQDHGQGWSGFEGNDTINGGDGFDEILYNATRGNNEEQAVTVNFATGTATDQWGYTDTFSDIERVRGSDFDDTFIGNADQGSVHYMGLAGADTIVGTTGWDWLEYQFDTNAGGNSGIHSDLTQGWVIDGFGDRDTVSQIDAIRATDYDDLVIGYVDTSGLNPTDFYTAHREGLTGVELHGLDGNDRLVGSEGFDKLYGGDGDDILDGSAGSYEFQGNGDEFRPGLGNDIVIGNASLFYNNGLQYAGFASRYLPSNFGDGSDILYDDVEGTGGVNFTIFGDGEGRVTSGNEGLIDTTFSYIHWFTGTDENDSFVSTSTAIREGFAGHAGDDYIDGGAGRNELFYIWDYKYGGNNGITVDFANGVATDSWGDTDTFINMNAVYATGSDDVIYGSSAIDKLHVHLFEGNDTFYGTSSIDVLDYQFSWVSDGIEVDLSAGVNQILDGAGGIDTVYEVDEVRGTGLADSFRGGSLSESFLGMGGDDIFYFSAGHDFMSGGAGFDTLILAKDQAAYTLTQELNGFYKVVDNATLDSATLAGVNQLQFGGDAATSTQSLIYGLGGQIYHWNSKKLLDRVNVEFGKEGDDSTVAAPFSVTNAREVDGQILVDLVLTQAGTNLNSFDLNIGGEEGVTLELSIASGLEATSWSSLVNSSGSTVSLSAAGFSMPDADVATAANLLDPLSGDLILGTLAVTGGLNVYGGPDRILLDFTEVVVADSSGETEIADYQAGVVHYATQTQADGSYGTGVEFEGDYQTELSRDLNEYDEGRVVSASDALAALKLAVGLNPNSDSAAVDSHQFYAADVNQDGKVSAADALAILKMAVGLDAGVEREWHFIADNTDISGTHRTNIDWSLIKAGANTAGADSNYAALLAGDVNGSWDDPLSASSGVFSV